MSPAADTDELRRAYRFKLRQTHPDTGGVAVDFHAVQHAWDLIGTPAGRAAYDSGASPSRYADTAVPTWAPSQGSSRRGTRPASTEYGDAGLWQRELYLDLLREWTGGPVAAPYDPVLVRSAPPQLRAVLARAIAEEADGEALAALGIGYTVWHDVATATGAPSRPGGDVELEKIDHIVLGASGLFAVASLDPGGPVRVRKGDLIGAMFSPDERPMHRLAVQAKYIAKTCAVPFTAIVIVVPDYGSDESVMLLGSMRGMPTLVAWRSRLPDLMRSGLGTLPFRGGAEVFDVRTRLRAGIRFA